MVQGIALVDTGRQRGYEEQFEEDKEREPAFAPDRNPIENSPGSPKRELGNPNDFRPYLDSLHQCPNDLSSSLPVGACQVWPDSCS
jgi:hypothetical protein